MRSKHLLAGRPGDARQTTVPAFVNTNLKMGLGKLRGPSESRADDGAILARQCLQSLDRVVTLPPTLFILLTTPSFQPYEDVLTGLFAELAEHDLAHVPLIGSSVGACAWGRSVYPNGAVLLCLASEMMTVQAGIGREAQNYPRVAVRELLTSLGLRSKQQSDKNSNRVLVTFLPGYAACGDPSKYAAAKILGEIRRQTGGTLHTFGGVSSVGLPRGMGSQFYNKEVLTQSAVGALLVSDVVLGLGLNHGTRDTGRTVQVRAVKDQGHVISDFWGKTVDEVREDWSPIDLLCWHRPDGDLIVAKPQFSSEGVKLQQSVARGATLGVVAACPDKMERSITKLHRWIQGNLTNPNAVVGSLIIGCVARYPHRKSLGFDVPQVVKRARDLAPNGVQVGVYMDGEIGIDHYERPVFGTWSISELVFTDEVPAQSELSLVSRAIAEHTEKAANATSVEDVIQAVLTCIQSARYVGAMLSLVLDDGDTTWIIAQDALGDSWKRKVVPRTRRNFNGSDVLVRVAKRRKSRYVNDTQDPRNHCDRKTARAGAVLSFYAMPLLDEERRTIGILQIDLGDMRSVRRLHEDKKAALDALGAWAGEMLNRAFKTDELCCLRELEVASMEVQEECDTVEAAADAFVKRAAKAMDMDGHARLYDPAIGVLRLVGGHGEYYEVARHECPDIEASDDIPSARVFVTNRRLVLADTNRVTNLVNHFFTRSSSSTLNAAIDRLRSVAIFPIRRREGSAVGVIAFYSDKSCFFTQHRLRLLKDIGTRISGTLTAVKKRQNELKKATFLRDIKPPLDSAIHTETALSVQARQASEAAGRDVKVACYLWDDSRDRFTLRAQFGWATSEDWTNAAFYRKGEGLIGTLATAKRPKYIDDLSDRQKNNPEYTEKYIKEIFGEPGGVEFTCEVVGLPIVSCDSNPGIFMLYRQKRLSFASQLGFTATDAQTLKEGSKILSAFVSVLKTHDYTKWHKSELQRCNAVVQALLKHQNRPAEALSGVFCQAVVDEYKLRLCAVYMPDDAGMLCLKNHARRWNDEKEQHDPIPGVLPQLADDAVRSAFDNERAVEIPRTSHGDHSSRKQCRRDGVIERVCVPIRVTGRPVIGVLDLRWVGTFRPAERGILPHHSVEDFQALASQFAEAIEMNQLRSAQLAIAVMAAYLQVKEHHMRNLAADAEALVGELEENVGQSTTLKDLGRKIRRLQTVLRKAEAKVAGIFGSKKSMPKRTQLDKILRSAISICTKSFADGEQTRIDDSAVQEVVAEVVRDQVFECFVAPIHNALRALRENPKGRERELSIKMFENTSTGEVMISMTDTGPGITADKLAAIRRGDWLPEDQRDGAGRGLYFAQLYSVYHGGQLEIESELGKGTTVLIRIPIGKDGGKR